MHTARRARDEWLALRCQAAEPGAFDSLVAEMEQPLFYYVFQIVKNQEIALELLQDTWVRALRNFASLKDPASVRAWLYKLAHGTAVDHIRRDQTRHRVEQRYADAIDAADVYDFAPADAEVLHKALGRLSEKHREVLVLHFLEDFSLGEIAAIVGCPQGTVKSRIHQGKAEMRALLSGGGYGRTA